MVSSLLDLQASAAAKSRTSCWHDVWPRDPGHRPGVICHWPALRPLVGAQPLLGTQLLTYGGRSHLLSSNHGGGHALACQLAETCNCCLQTPTSVWWTCTPSPFPTTPQT